MTKKILKILIALLVILLVIGAFYWFFLQQQSVPPEEGEEERPTTFNPFNRGSVVQLTPSPEEETASGITDAPAPLSSSELPKLRQLSSTPVGGYMASTTASSTLVRYIDRGVGHVYDTKSNSPAIEKISNTTIPRVYESYWNKNASAAVLRYTREDTKDVINFFADIRKIPATASSTPSVIPYEIKGRFLSADIQAVAVSPKGDRIFTLNREEERSVGYISNFDESKRTKIFDTPLTQVNIEWPEEGTLALSTKASQLSRGYLYLINVKQPTQKRVLGDIYGLSAKVSPDLEKVIFSSSGPRGFTTSLLSLKDNSIQEVVFRTTADKCVWSKLDTHIVYCAVPVEIPQGIYPDDWYKGNVLFMDQIWHLDTVTGEVRIIANLLKLGDALIDATNLVLDPKDKFLYFTNKRDLSLWSLDLGM